ncbi:MAG: hypothetical protein PHN88_00570 [Ignavibacteria bacterium]|nr:hypothetical protein [Ignavibacteria bacterium]
MNLELRRKTGARAVSQRYTENTQRCTRQTRHGEPSGGGQAPKTQRYTEKNFFLFPAGKN